MLLFSFVYWPEHQEDGESLVWRGCRSPGWTVMNYWTHQKASFWKQRESEASGPTCRHWYQVIFHSIWSTSLFLFHLVKEHSLKRLSVCQNWSFLEKLNFHMTWSSFFSRWQTGHNNDKPLKKAFAETAQLKDVRSILRGLKRLDFTGKQTAWSDKTFDLMSFSPILSFQRTLTTTINLKIYSHHWGLQRSRKL